MDLGWQTALQAPKIFPLNLEKGIKSSTELLTMNRIPQRNIVWSDKKQFLLDLPDGWTHNWGDLKREDQIFQLSRTAGVSVML